MNIHVSMGNKKLGGIKNISLPPYVTCKADALCKKRCYAIKSFRQYPNCRIAWSENLQVYNDNPREYWNQLAAWFGKRRKHIEYFRFHVAGDIPDLSYFKHMVRFCKYHSDTKFLCFTKRYELVKLKDSIPSNLSMIFSHWMNDGVKLNGVRQAWVYDPKDIDKRIPKSAYQCPADCQLCGLKCWKLGYNQSVKFNIH